MFTKNIYYSRPLSCCYLLIVIIQFSVLIYSIFKYIKVYIVFVFCKYFFLYSVLSRVLNIDEEEMKKNI